MRELKQAEESAAQADQVVVVHFALTAELKAAFTAIGEKLPQIWEQDLLSREQKKALLRCLIENEPPRVSRRLQLLRGWSH